MLQLLYENFSTVIIALLTAALLTAAVISMIKQKKRGKCAGCSSCPMANKCGKA